MNIPVAVHIGLGRGGILVRVVDDVGGNLGRDPLSGLVGRHACRGLPALNPRVVVQLLEPRAVIGASSLVRAEEKIVQSRQGVAVNDVMQVHAVLVFPGVPRAIVVRITPELLGCVTEGEEGLRHGIHLCLIGRLRALDYVGHREPASVDGHLPRRAGDDLIGPEGIGIREAQARQ